MREFQRLRSAVRRRRVPVENTGGPGTRLGHWRESVFSEELMSGYLAQPGNALSALTVASLADLGYQVDLEAAEPYVLPNSAAAGQTHLLAARSAPPDGEAIAPVVPAVLPADGVVPSPRRD